jgi:hypothetical protein
MKKIVSLLFAFSLSLAIPAMGQYVYVAPSKDVAKAKPDFSNVAGHYAYVAGGYSHIYTKMEDGWTSGDARFGFDWQVGYEWISNKKIGAGFLYEGYSTSGKKIEIEVYKGNMMIHYFAPQFVGITPLGSGRWVLHYGVGIGLAMMVDRLKGDKGSNGRLVGRNTDFGFGSHLSFGAEYRVSPKVGITGTVSVLSANIDQKFMGVDYQPKNNEVNGFQRVSIDFGVRYHF